MSNGFLLTKEVRVRFLQKTDMNLFTLDDYYTYWLNFRQKHYITKIYMEVEK